MDRISKILELASESVFYRNRDGEVYRINYTDFGDGVELTEVGEYEDREGFFFDVVDENTGEEYRIFPENMSDEDSFYKTIEVKVKDVI